MIDILKEIQATAADERDEANKILKYFFSTQPDEATMDDVLPFTDRLRHLSGVLGEPKYAGWAYGREAMVMLYLQRFVEAGAGIERALEIFEPTMDHEAIAKTQQLAGWRHTALGNYKDAIAAFEQVIVHVTAHGAHRVAGSVYGSMGDSYISLGLYEEAIKCFNLCLEYGEKYGWLRSRLAPQSHGRIGTAQMAQGNFVAALKSFLLAREGFGALDDLRGLAEMDNCMGSLYSAQADNENALRYYERALDYYIEIQDSHEISQGYISIAHLLLLAGRYEDAQAHLDKSLQIALRLGVQNTIAVCYIEMGDLAFVLKQFEEALKFYAWADDINHKIGYKEGLIRTGLALAAICREKNKYDEALVILLDLEKIVLEIKSEAMQRDCSLAISEIYEALNQYDKAFQYYREYHRASTVILGEESRKQLNQLSFQHNLEQVEKNLELEKTARKSEEEKNVLLSAQKDLIEKSLRDRETLLKEIHHRVKNNLQIISSLLELQSTKIDDEQARAAISEGQNRVRSIALIHSKLYQEDDISAIEFKSFAEELYRQIAGGVKDRDQTIETSFDIAEINLDIDTAVPLGLILNELITNAFKYAFNKRKAGTLYLHLANLGEGRYSLIVKDNGKGLPENYDYKKAKSLGLRLINNLSRQIGGSSSYQYDGGAIFTITFADTQTRKLTE